MKNILQFKCKGIIIWFFFMSIGATAQTPELVLPMGHTSQILITCMSPDGTIAASASKDGTVILWRTSNWTQMKQLTGFNDNLLCFSGDSKLLIYSTKDKLIFYDIQSKTVSKEFTKGGDKETFEAISPDATYAISLRLTKGGLIETYGVILWNLSNGIAQQIHEGFYLTVDISYQGNYVVVYSMDEKNSLYLIDIKNDSKRSLTFHKGNKVRSFSFSYDGKFLALESGEDGPESKLFVYNLTDKKVESTIKLQGMSFTRKFMRDNQNLIVKDYQNNKLLFFNIDKGKQTNAIPFTKNTVYFLTCDNQNLFCGADDGQIKMVNILTGNEEKITKPLLFNKISSAAISPDGNWIAERQVNGLITIWNTANLKNIRRIQGNKRSSSNLAFSYDSKILAYGTVDKKIALMDLNSGQIVKNLDPQLSFFSIDFSSDGKQLVSTFGKDVFYVWDIASGMVKWNLKGSKYTHPVWAAKFSNDGKYIVSGSEDRLVKLWDAASGKELYTYGTHISERSVDLINSHNKPVYASCFAMDGKYLITASDFMDEIIVWNTTGGIICTLKYPKDNTNWGVYYPSVPLISSKDNKYVFAVYGNKIQAWDIQKIYRDYGETGLTNQVPPMESPVKSFVGHANSINSLSITDDFKILISSSNDATIRGWDVASGKHIFTLVPVGENDWVVTTPEGLFDGTENAYQSLYFTTGTEQIPLSNLFDQFYTPNLLARLLHGEIIEKPAFVLKDLKPAPWVQIISPEHLSTSSSETVTITVKVTDQGGGIDEILLYLNGKLVQTTNRGFKLVELKGSEQTKTFTITLADGENRVKATALNAQRTEATPVEIVINFSGTQLAKPDLYLFVIGINEYKNAKYNLNYAVADALGFKQTIEQGSNTIFNSIKTTYLTNADALRPRILEEIDKIKSQVKQEDVFIFYYAGHGVMSEEQIPQFYIIPHDVTQLYGNEELLQTKGISATELKQISTEIKAQKQLYILDACQSGGMTGMLASRGAAEEKAINQLARSTGTYWLAASNSEQFAGEFDQLGHGLFTYCILQALSGKADGQNDKKVTVQELSTFLNDQVPIISKQYKGSEQYPNTYGYGHDFPILIVK